MPDLDHVLALPTGTLLNHRYHITQALGAGGFGITYYAEDTALDRHVALKELYPQHLYPVTRDGTALTVPSSTTDNHQNLVRRVIKQGHLFRSFQHPNLVEVYEAFLANNTAYLVMAYLEGVSVRRWLGDKGPMPEPDVARLVEDIAAGLKYLHSRGALHLDVKPSNIVFSGGRFVLIDYGESKMTGEALTVHLSTGGATPAYMALEQSDVHLDRGPYTDLYALGVTVYECVRGVLPPSCMAQLAGRVVEPLTGVEDAVLRRRVEWAMQIKAEDRPQSVDQWLAEPPSSDELRTIRMKEPTVDHAEKTIRNHEMRSAGHDSIVSGPLHEVFDEMFKGSGSHAQPDAPPVQPPPPEPQLHYKPPVTPEPKSEVPVGPGTLPPKKADTGKRIVAVVLDNIIASMIGFVVFLFGYALGYGSSYDEEVGAGFGLLLFALVSLTYTLFRDGFGTGSPGKRIIKLRLVRLDGKSLDLGTSFKRNWMWCIGVLAVIPDESWIGLVMLTSLCITVYEIYKVTSDPNGRRWGDYLAGTRLIEPPRK